MPGMLNCDWTLETSASLMDIGRGHSVGICAFLDFTMIPCNMAHVFLYNYMEAKDNLHRS